jgi:uncharacterized linocin/CFP29 family protein
MNGSLGRDRVWNEHIWGEIDKAVREEVGRVRVAQKVFPSTVVNNVLPVSANRAVPFEDFNKLGRPVELDSPPEPGIDQFQPFFEISREFVLTQAQVDGEENTHLAASLARLAASTVASTEDAILFLGKHGIPAAVPSKPPAVHVTNQPDAIPYGFVAEANNFPAFPVPAKPPPLGDILAAVAGGIAELNKDAQPGPYALFLSPNRYAQTFAPAGAGQLEAPGDQIKQIVTGGFYMLNSVHALPEPEKTEKSDIGILVSLGGEPVKIILGTEAMTAFTHTDAQSNYHFRVFERIQMVVRDGRAFQTLKFPPPPGATGATGSTGATGATGSTGSTAVTGSREKPPQKK